jgi:hypothetical protein
MQPIPTTQRSQQVYNPEKGVVTPYTQNLTLSLTRSLSKAVTLDLRYVGTSVEKAVESRLQHQYPQFSL